MKKFLSLLAVFSVFTFAGCCKKKSEEKPKVKKEHVKKDKSMKKKSCKSCDKTGKKMKKSY